MYCSTVCDASHKGLINEDLQLDTKIFFIIDVYLKDRLGHKSPFQRHGHQLFAFTGVIQTGISVASRFTYVVCNKTHLSRMGTAGGAYKTAGVNIPSACQQYRL